MSNNTSDFIKKFLNEKISTAETEKEFFREQIVILDNARTDYQKAVYKVDSTLLPPIENVNNKILDVRTAYDNRVNSGCRTDVFWRYTGITTTEGETPGSIFTFQNYVCVKASPNGLGLSTITYLTNSGTASTSNNLLGLQPDNLYGIRMYDEPYCQDIIESYVGSFIGTIGLGSSVLTVMSPRLSSQISDDIKVGQLIICSDPQAFPGLNVEIVGIGTTLADLSKVDAGFGTTPILVDQLTLEFSSLTEVKAPQDDGTFATFTILKDPDELQNIGLPPASSPYVPQTIKMMNSSNVGMGASIDFDNASGYPDISQTWNQFMEGFQDPDRINDPTARIVKPKVGAGKVYYRTGFDAIPEKYNGSSWVRAQPGDTGQNSDNPLIADQVRVSSTPSCSSTITNSITNAESARDAAETALANTNSEFQQKIALSNLIRTELNEMNIRIWAYRSQMGQASSSIDTYNGKLFDLDSNAYKDLIDN
jgi:hypothetical protein